MTECERVQRLLALRPAEWSAAERERVAAHLAGCAACAAVARAYGEQDRLLRALPRAALTAEQRRAMLARAHGELSGQRPGARLVGSARAAAGTLAALAVIALLAVGLGALLRGGTAAVPLPRDDVAELLARRPAPGEVVEIDAYFSAGTSSPMRGGPRQPAGSDQRTCPTQFSWSLALTDRPFAGTLQVLNLSTGNPPPPEAAWLAAAPPEAEQPGEWAVPQLPYHARLRGRLADPEDWAGCPTADRIFIVEDVVAVYEQDPPAAAGPLRPPADFASWPLYRDEALGYALSYPPGWTATPEPLPTVDLTLLSNVVVRDPARPGRPVIVQVQAGELLYDQYDPAAAPAELLEAESWGVFEQGWAFPVPQDGDLDQPGTQTAWPPDSQHLAGYMIEAAGGDGTRTVTVLFSAHGYTYRLSLTFPTGLDASQELLTLYSAMVESFRLDEMPGPTPTPPIKQSLGPGPFLGRDEALARVPDGQNVELLAWALVPEAEARAMADACGTFTGHPDGVWVLTVRGRFEDMDRTMVFYIDAVTGESLCGEETIPPPAPPTPMP